MNTSNGQNARLDSAIAITERQIEKVADLLKTAGINNVPETRLAMLQVLATNYAAEEARST